MCFCLPAGGYSGHGHAGADRAGAADRWAEPFTARCRTASPPRPTPPHLACAGGQIEIAGCDPASYDSFLRFLAGTGVQVSRVGDCVRLARDPAVPLRGGAHLRADAWPAFATDTAPLAAAVLLTAAGRAEIYDSLFANRFACAAGFAAMGAACTVRGRQLTLPGGSVLHGRTSLRPTCAAERRFWRRHWPRTVRPACATPGTSPAGMKKFTRRTARAGGRDFLRPSADCRPPLRIQAGHARPLRGDRPAHGRLQQLRFSIFFSHSYTKYVALH